MNKLKLLLPFIAALVFGCNSDHAKGDKLSVVNLTCEYKTNPLGIELPNPGLGWQLKSDERNQSQSAYQIIVSDDPELLNTGKGNIWDSKKVNSDQSILIKYSGAPLKPGEKYYWKVKTWDKNNIESDWSETAFWQMGLLSEADWKNAKWIGYEDLPDEERLVPGLHQGTEKKSDKAKKRDIIPLFRKEFSVTKTIKSATLYISGLGQYEASLNGQKIGNGFPDSGMDTIRQNDLL